MAASLADVSGVSPRDLCEAAMWANSSVFARFYRLDLVASRNMSSQILQTALINDM